jgi:hypothetical protein
VWRQVLQRISRVISGNSIEHCFAPEADSC